MSHPRDTYVDPVLAMPVRERYALDARPRTDKPLEFRSVRVCSGGREAPWPWDPGAVRHG